MIAAEECEQGTKFPCSTLTLEDVFRFFCGPLTANEDSALRAGGVRTTHSPCAHLNTAHECFQSAHNTSHSDSCIVAISLDMSMGLLLTQQCVCLLRINIWVEAVSSLARWKAHHCQVSQIMSLTVHPVPEEKSLPQERVDGSSEVGDPG